MILGFKMADKLIGYSEPVQIRTNVSFYGPNNVVVKFLQTITANEILK